MLVTGGLKGSAEESERLWEEFLASTRRQSASALVQGLYSNARDHLLRAGTLGRGTWILKNPLEDCRWEEDEGADCSPTWAIPGTSLADPKCDCQ